MQVAHHYFENGIAHFTRHINKCISMACANNNPGDNNKKKIWSETNVSEDFDMALRLQVGVLYLSWEGIGLF